MVSPGSAYGCVNMRGRCDVYEMYGMSPTRRSSWRSTSSFFESGDQRTFGRRASGFGRSDCCGRMATTP